MTPSKPSIILLGSKPGSVVALEYLLARGWYIKGVVPSDMSSHDFIKSDTLESVAKQHNIRVYSDQESLPSEKVDFVVSYMFRYLVTNKTRELAKRAALNFHAGPLPEFGGWAFYNMAILEQAKQYGCTCHHMDEGFDTGPLVKVNRFDIDATKETAFSLERKAQQEMVRLFRQVASLAEETDPLPKIPQDPSRMRYLDKNSFMALKEISLEADEEETDRVARAFFYPPYDCAYILLNGKKLEVLPKIASQQVGEIIHLDDLIDLRNTADRAYKNNGEKSD